MDRDRELFTQLSNCQIPSYKELLSEENLVEAKLVPAAAMKISASDFEAALKQKRQATGETSRPAKRIRRREPARSTGAPTAPTPAEEPAEREPVARVAQRLAGADVEEGEIPITAETPVVVLDEEEAPAVADMPEAGQVTVAVGPPAAAEPGRESAPPTASEGEQIAREAQDGAEATEKQRDEPRSSSHQPVWCLGRLQAEGPQEGQTRMVRTIERMTDAA